MGSPEDNRWMQLALELAERGRFKVSPNPMVGACIVKSGKLISEGYHAGYGDAHAEVMALRRAGSKAEGARLYVTLEPCTSWGKTPPCAAAIAESGIKEVVIGALDPNPKHHGEGVRMLRSAGLKVRSEILSDQVKKQNDFFFKFIRTGMPWVTLKMAQSLDGKIATRTGKSRWITGPAARNYVHQLRAEQDAVLVGTSTLFKDNPHLTTHLDKHVTRPGKPWRVILDPRFQAKPSMDVFAGTPLTLRVVTEPFLKTPLPKRAETRNAFNFLPVTQRKGRLDVKDLVQKLGQLGVAKLLVEGGGETAWSFLEAGLVDRVIWMVAPMFLGGRESKTSVEGPGVSDPECAIRFQIIETKQIGQDLLIEAVPVKSKR